MDTPSSKRVAKPPPTPRSEGSRPGSSARAVPPAEAPADSAPRATSSARQRAAADEAGPYRQGVTCDASSMNTQQQRGGAADAAPVTANTSSFTVLLQPYRDTVLARRPALTTEQTGALARFGPPTLELGSIEGEHPHAARVNVGHSCPPGTILALNAELNCRRETMNSVVHVVDTVHRTSLVMNMRVNFNDDRRVQEAAATAAERAKCDELRARLEAAHAEVSKARENAEAERQRAAQLEARVHTVTAERDAFIQREEARRIEIERLRDNDRRRNAERQAAAEREVAMERLREREKRDLEARAREREAERVAEQDRQKEREAERRAVAWEMQRIDQERQQFAHERLSFEAERRAFEAERERYAEREAEWRMHMHSALSEVSICRACSSRHVTEQHLKFTQERLARALDERSGLQDEVARLRAREAARRTADLRLGPLPSAVAVHGVTAAVCRPLLAADIRFEGQLEAGTIEARLSVPVQSLSAAVDHVHAIKRRFDAEGAGRIRSLTEVSDEDADLFEDPTLQPATWLRVMRSPRIVESCKATTENDAAMRTLNIGLCGDAAAQQLFTASVESEAFVDPAAAPEIDLEDWRGMIEVPREVAACSVDQDAADAEDGDDDDVSASGSELSMLSFTAEREHASFRRIFAAVRSGTRQLLALAELEVRTPPVLDDGATRPSDQCTVEHIVRYKLIRQRCPVAADLTALVRSVGFMQSLDDPLLGSSEAQLSLKLALGVRSDGLYHVLRRDAAIPMKVLPPALVVDRPVAGTACQATVAVSAELRGSAILSAATVATPFDKACFSVDSEYIDGSGRPVAKLFSKRMVISVSLVEIDAPSVPAITHPSEVGEIMLSLEPDAASKEPKGGDKNLPVSVGSSDGIVWVGGRAVGRVVSGRLNRTQFGNRGTGQFGISAGGETAGVGSSPTPRRRQAFRSPPTHQVVISFENVDVGDSNRDGAHAAASEPMEDGSSTMSDGTAENVHSRDASALAQQGCLMHPNELLSLARAVNLTVSNHAGRRMLHFVVEGREERTDTRAVEDTLLQREGTSAYEDDPPDLANTRVADTIFRDVSFSLGAAVTVHSVLGADIAPGPRMTAMRAGPRAPALLERTLPAAQTTLLPGLTVSARGTRTAGVSIHVDVEYVAGPIIAGDELLLDCWIGGDLQTPAPTKQEQGATGGVAGGTRSSRRDTTRPTVTASSTANDAPGAVIAVESVGGKSVVFNRRERLVIGTVESRVATASTPPKLVINLSDCGAVTIAVLQAVLRSLTIRAAVSTDTQTPPARLARQAEVRVLFGRRVVADIPVTVSASEHMLNFPFPVPVQHLEGSGPQRIFAAPKREKHDGSDPAASNRGGKRSRRTRTRSPSNRAGTAAAAGPEARGLELRPDADALLAQGLVIGIAVPSQPDPTTASRRGTGRRAVSVANLRSSMVNPQRAKVPAFTLNVLRRIEATSSQESAGSKNHDDHAAASRRSPGTTAGSGKHGEGCSTAYTVVPIPPEAVGSIHPDWHTSGSVEAFGVARTSDSVEVGRMVLSPTAVEMHFTDSAAARDSRGKRRSVANRTGLSDGENAAAASTTKTATLADVNALIHAVTLHATRTMTAADEALFVRPASKEAHAPPLLPLRVVATELRTFRQHHYAVGMTLRDAGTVTHLQLPRSLSLPRVAMPPTADRPGGDGTAEVAVCPGVVVCNAPLAFLQSFVKLEVWSLEGDAVDGLRCFIAGSARMRENCGAGGQLTDELPADAGIVQPSELLRDVGVSVFGTHPHSDPSDALLPWMAGTAGTEGQEAVWGRGWGNQTLSLRRREDPDDLLSDEENGDGDGMGDPVSGEHTKDGRDDGTAFSLLLNGRVVGCVSSWRGGRQADFMRDGSASMSIEAPVFLSSDSSDDGLDSDTALAPETGSRESILLLRAELRDVTPEQVSFILGHLHAALDTPMPHGDSDQRPGSSAALVIKMSASAVGVRRSHVKTSTTIQAVSRAPLLLSPALPSGFWGYRPLHDGHLPRLHLPRLSSAVFASGRARPFASIGLHLPDRAVLPPGAFVWFGIEPGPLCIGEQTDVNATGSTTGGSRGKPRRAKGAAAVSSAAAEPGIDAVSLELPAERNGYSVSITSSDTSLGLHRLVQHGGRGGSVAEALVSAQRIVVASSSSAQLTGKHLKALLPCFAVRGPIPNSKGQSGEGSSKDQDPTATRQTYRHTTRLQRARLIWWEGPGAPLGVACHDLVISDEPAASATIERAPLVLHTATDGGPVPCFVAQGFPVRPCGALRVALNDNTGRDEARSSAVVHAPTVARVTFIFIGTSSNASAAEQAGNTHASSTAGSSTASPALPWAPEAVGLDLEPLCRAILAEAPDAPVSDEDSMPDALVRLFDRPPVQLQRPATRGNLDDLQPAPPGSVQDDDVIIDTRRSVAVARVSSCDARRGISLELLEGAVFGHGAEDEDDGPATDGEDASPRHAAGSVWWAMQLARCFTFRIVEEPAAQRRGVGEDADGTLQRIPVRRFMLTVTTTTGSSVSRSVPVQPVRTAPERSAVDDAGAGPVHRLRVTAFPMQQHSSPFGAVAPVRPGSDDAQGSSNVQLFPGFALFTSQQLAHLKPAEASTVAPAPGEGLTIVARLCDPATAAPFSAGEAAELDVAALLIDSAHDPGVEVVTTAGLLPGLAAANAGFDALESGAAARAAELALGNAIEAGNASTLAGFIESGEATGAASSAARIPTKSPRATVLAVDGSPAATVAVHPHCLVVRFAPTVVVSPEAVERIVRTLAVTTSHVRRGGAGMGLAAHSSGAGKQASFGAFGGEPSALFRNTGAFNANESVTGAALDAERLSRVRVSLDVTTNHGHVWRRAVVVRLDDASDE